MNVLYVDTERHALIDDEKCLCTTEKLQHSQVQMTEKHKYTNTCTNNKKAMNTCINQLNMACRKPQKQ